MAVRMPSGKTNYIPQSHSETVWVIQGLNSSCLFGHVTLPFQKQKQVTTLFFSYMPYNVYMQFTLLKISRLGTNKIHMK